MSAAVEPGGEWIPLMSVGVRGSRVVTGDMLAAMVRNHDQAVPIVDEPNGSMVLGWISALRFRKATGRLEGRVSWVVRPMNHDLSASDVSIAYRTDVGDRITGKRLGPQVYEAFPSSGMRALVDRVG